MRIPGWVFCLLLAGRLALGGQAVARIEGRVLGVSRAPVSGATVRLETGSRTSAATTDSRGWFVFDLPADEPGGPALLRVEAHGYAPAQRRLSETEASEPVEIELSPASFSEKVAVIAARRPERVSETPSSVASVTSEDLARSAVPALDEALRQVPGFTLFRRNDSRTANPTTQGPSLRGVGGSGASRAAVLDDGIPLNDPFGGWVSWGRVPLASLDRVEILRGGGSSLYGGPALSGAVALFRREPDAPWAAGEASYGSRNTPEASAAAAGRSGPWSARLAAEAFRTDGYVAVAPEERGPVDTEFASRHGTADLTLERGETVGNRVFVRGAYYTESRENGTPLQDNDTDLRQLAAGADFPAASGSVSLRAYGMRERYHQSFSSVSADRTTETLVRDQRVPSDAWGGSGQWAAEFSSHRLVAGFEGRRVTGSSDETVFSGGGGTSFATAGGTQATGAVFAEDSVALSPRWTVTAGARFDAWRNFDASRGTGPSSSQVTSQGLPDRSETAFSPRLAALYRADSSLALTASAYRSFRAPTLNELYRSFRLGNTTTLANADLSAERLTGAEAGAIVTPAGNAIAARAVLFWMEVSDPIANVTLSTTPSLITRQRQNLGRTRSRGVELDAEARLSGAFSVAIGYLFADSTVESFAANPKLVGLRVPQVPRHQGSARLAWRLPSGGELSVLARAATNQFEDDENTLPLGPMAVFDALFETRVFQGISVFLAGENLLDRRYTVARTPLTNLGAPRAVRGGLRFRLGSV